MAPDLYALYHLTRSMYHDVYPSISPANPTLSVKGQTVLITGGGSGIGLATAKFYAQAGARHVVITGRTVDALETARGEILGQSLETEVTAIATDVSSKESVTALWKKVNEEVGKVNVLVNSAGVGGAHHKTGEGDVDEWWSVQVSSNIWPNMFSMTNLPRKPISAVPTLCAMHTLDRWPQ
jgi:NAD(P)-dependent dehydrogenase (short-subunit alcohol dehydrogenase family)